MDSPYVCVMKLTIIELTFWYNDKLHNWLAKLHWCHCEQLWIKTCTRWHMLIQLWQHCLRYQWPKYHCRRCAPRPLWSLPDGACTLMEKPQGYGDMNGQVLTFDSSALYPQLWINDSKGPHPWALMCSAKLQAARREQSEKCAIKSVQYSDTVTVL